MKSAILLQKYIIDKKYYSSRIWSNRELMKFSHLFTGDVLNVSGWKDEDSEGGYYKQYFLKAKSYSISNYKSEIKGLQGFNNEFYLDLEDNLLEGLVKKWDVVFNHTTLEHIYNFNKAFKNMCLLSKDIVIIVVPFLQQMHGEYGDYWRFSPLAVKQLFDENHLSLVYLSFNNTPKHSVYIFSIASRNPEKWKSIYKPFSYKCKSDIFDSHENYIGCRAIPNNIVYKIFHTIYKKLFF